MWKATAMRLGRISSLLVVVAVLTSIVGPDVPRTGLAQDTAIYYFALGDSVASGHGIKPSQTPCARSSKAYPYKVKDYLDSIYGDVYFYHVACSGATTQDLPGQVDFVLSNYVRSPAPGITADAVVTITIGANDFGWLSWDTIMGVLSKPADQFFEYISQRQIQMSSNIRTQVSELLENPNIRIVLTDYHNPMNRESMAFSASWADAYADASLGGNLLDNCLNLLGTTINCYERTEMLIHQVNYGIIVDVWARLGRPSRLSVASIHEAFHGHESQSSWCGSASLSGETWVQPIGDRNSDQPLPLPNWLENLTGETVGDCVHPNEKGALAIANAVSQRLAGMLRASSVNTGGPVTSVGESGSGGSSQPGIPTLLSPADGITVPQNEQLSFTWSNTGAARYKFEAWNDDNPGDSRSEILTATSFSFAPGSTGHWRWQVRSMPPNGQPGDAPHTRSFTVGAANGIELCDGPNYAGPCQLFTEGKIDDLAGQGWADRAESIRFRGNYIGMYHVHLDTETNLHGTPLHTDQDIPNLSSPFANHIRSLDITRHEGAVLCDDADFGGTCHTFPIGEYRSLGEFGLEGKVTSIRTSGRYHVTLFDDVDLRGTPAHYVADVSRLDAYWNDRARSVRVEEFRELDRTCILPPDPQGVILYLRRDYNPEGGVPANHGECA